MKIQASAEDYLECILVLSQKKDKVRSVDIAQHLGFAKPTISIIMKQFRENGYIEIDADRCIYLTPKGEAIAKSTYERHMLLANFLIEIGVDEETAYADACKIEHNISETSFQKLKAFYEKYSAQEVQI